MAKIVDLVVPNIGDFKNVEIIEVLIKENQNIKKNDGIITYNLSKRSKYGSRPIDWKLG